MKHQNIHNFITLSAFKVGILSTFLCCIVYSFTATQKAEIFYTLDSHIVDFMFHLRGTEDSSGSVVIVDIDEQSLNKYGQWPWPRDLVAELTEKILASEPVVLGFDIMFAERDRSSPTAFLKQYQPTAEKDFNNALTELENFFSPLPNHDEGLGKVLQNSNIVQGYRFLFREDFLKNSDQIPQLTHTLSRPSAITSFNEIQLVAAYRPILNISELRTGGAEGFLNLFHDESGAVRKTSLFLLMDDIPYPSMVMEMFQTTHPEDVPTLLLSPRKNRQYSAVNGISLGERLYKTDDFGQININFRGPSNTFLYLSARDVLNGSEASFLRGKYVLLGSTASGMVDLVSTPFSSRMPCVEVHATILDNLIKNDPFTWEQDQERWLTYILVLFAGLTVSALLVYLHPLLGLFTVFITFFSLAASNYYFLFSHQKLIGFSYIYVALIVIFIIVTLCNYVFEGKKRLFIKRAFSHYVSPAVVTELVKHPEKLHLQVDTREVSILFCDIRGFTTLAEKTSPADLSLFLNTYFSLLTDIIIKHNGMIDKFIGDAIMAVWGTPLEDTAHASNSVKAALEMVEATEKHQHELILADQPVRIGIGINSGMVSAGNFGSSRRFDYTVLGDNVNLASRIEGLTKYYPVRILITQFTYDQLQRSSRCRFIDTVQVKGRINPVELFEPLMDDNIERIEELEYSQYLKALKYYRAGDFKKAATFFADLFSSHRDPLYQMYNERCLKLLSNPQTKPWRGIYPHN